MGPSPVQRKLLIPLTAAISFFAGLFASRGQVTLVVATLLTLALGWLAVAIYKIGERPGN